MPGPFPALAGPEQPPGEQVVRPAPEGFTTRRRRQALGADRLWQKPSRLDKRICYNSVSVFLYPSPWTHRCHFLRLWLCLHCSGTVLSPSPRPQASELSGLGSPQESPVFIPPTTALANWFPVSTALLGGRDFSGQ